MESLEVRNLKSWIWDFPPEKKMTTKREDTNVGINNLTERRNTEEATVSEVGEVMNGMLMLRAERTMMNE